MNEPFLYLNDPPVVLLDLLLPQRQIGDERYVETFFDYGDILIKPYPSLLLWGRLIVF